MRISYTEGVLRVEDICFDPQLILIDSAQVFHWRQEGGLFLGVVGGRNVSLRKEEGGFSLFGAMEKDIPFWRKYFDLDRDYDHLAAVCKDYPMAKQAIEMLPGMHVLNQPAWETLISFILSANNNVLRIRGLVAKLIDACGEQGAFPSPEQLAGVPEEKLRAIGCGYRAPYLIDTAKKVRDGFPLEALREEEYEEAHRMLLMLPGVGDKVADCVQLFGLGHSQAFPVDVWVERLMRKWFMPNAGGKKEIRRRAYEMFGVHAGLVQQSLFHCARLGLISLDDDE